MANKERGEVSIAARGKHYTFRPSMNAICALEELTGKGLAEIAEAAERGRVSAVRAMIWAYLQPCHGDEIKTLEDAGRWMDDAGGLTAITGAISQVNALNVGHETGDRPQEAQASTGENSSLSLVGQD